MVALVFILTSSFSNEKKLLDGRGLFGGNVCKNVASNSKVQQ